MHPVVCVSLEDVNEYVAWLVKQTGKKYGLLSEAEYEYAARAGSTTPFWWGATLSPKLASYNYAGGGSKGTVSVQSFKPNPWGLYQVHGNAWTWTKDCWHDNYDGTPTDGTAWTSGECKRGVLRRGAWGSVPGNLRAASRAGFDQAPAFDQAPCGSIGFRVARPVNP